MGASRAKRGRPFVRPCVRRFRSLLRIRAANGGGRVIGPARAPPAAGTRAEWDTGHFVRAKGLEPPPPKGPGPKPGASANSATPA